MVPVISRSSQLEEKPEDTAVVPSLTPNRVLDLAKIGQKHRTRKVFLPANIFALIKGCFLVLLAARFLTFKGHAWNSG